MYPGVRCDHCDERRSASPHDAQKQARILSRASRDPEEHGGSRITMTSVPKRWVMKPLSPRFEKSDLRTLLSPGAESCSSENSWSLKQNGDSHTLGFDDISVTSVSSVRVVNGEGLEDVVHAKHVLVYEDSSASEDFQSSAPNSPLSACSSDCHEGFYSFVDDPTSPEAEKNEVYMVSPQRQAKLSTLTQKSRFKLQTYAEERRPEKLFQETNGDDLYYIHDVSGDEDEDETPDRMQVIRSQAPKKKEQWSSSENLDLTKSSQSLVEGLSLCYSTGSTKPLPSGADPGTVDIQQIDFNAARQQFQLMEQTTPKPFWRSSQESLSPKKRERSLSAGAKLFSKCETPKQHPWRRAENKVMPFKEELEDSILPCSLDQIDFGIASSSSVGSASTEPSALDGASETPIEREIRITQEREQDLRRSRGIFHPDASEMVEIRTKPILSRPTPPIKAIKTKEPNRVSLLIQRENQRVHQNREEKTRTFGSLSDLRDTTPWSGINPASRGRVEAEQSDVCDAAESLSPCCPHRHPDETTMERCADVPDRTLGATPYTEWRAEKERYHLKNQPFWISDYKPKESRKTSSPPAFPPEPERRSRSPGVWRSFPGNASEWPRMPDAPDLIRKEMEEDLRREQELQEQRENLSLVSDASSGNDRIPINRSEDNLMEVLPEHSTHRNRSLYSGNLDPSSVRSPSVAGPRSELTPAQPRIGPRHATPAGHGFVPAVPSSPLGETFSYTGMTKTLLNDLEERRVRLKLEESSYAGIQPIDDINNEVVEVTRVTRHKNTRALRWEAGVYANQHDH